MEVNYAYRLQYYKEIESHGHIWRLEFWRYSPFALLTREIGQVLQGLRLVVQGDQANVDGAIVKTSLEMRFVDVTDVPSALKIGNWEEFYTASSTEWKTMLYKDGVLEWTGYVTPDSYAEDLRYRGSVTIIARDNIGHMQDFSFDMTGDEDGMVRLDALVTRGLNTAGFAMYVTGGGGPEDPNADALLKCEEGSKVTQSLFNVGAFEGKTWYDAIEAVLYSTGMTLRYIGGNTFALAPMRRVPLFGRELYGEVPKKNASFLAFGRRELAPAARRIVENVAFELSDVVADPAAGADDYGQEGAADWGMTETEGVSVPVHEMIGGEWDERLASESGYLNPFVFGEAKETAYDKRGSLKDSSSIYMLTSIYGSNESYWKPCTFTRRLRAGKYKVKFTVEALVTLNAEMTHLRYTEGNSGLSFMSLYGAFIGDDGTVYRYYQYGDSDPGWAEAETADEDAYAMPNVGVLPFQYETAELEVAVDGVLTFGFEYGALPFGDDKESWVGSYMKIKDTELISLTDTPTMENLRITTNYNEANNVTLTRSPEFAPNPSDVVAPAIVKNGMFVEDAEGNIVGSDSWYWHESAEHLPLAAFIHQQVLAYYARPNNVLSGELIDIENDDLRFDAIYEWGGKEHMLMAGTLNILTGRIEGATLREFERYERMWEDNVSRDLIVVDYEACEETITYAAESGGELAPTGVPEWITYAGGVNAQGQNEITFYIAKNTTDETRAVYLNVGTAVVKIVQKGDIPDGYEEFLVTEGVFSASDGAYYVKL